MRTLLTACFASLLISFSAVAAIDVYVFDNEQQEQQFKELSQTLRCPKCQNNTISDSNAELAKDLRSKVYEMTKQGKSSDEIVDYMVDRYGNFVTYNPPLTAATSVLWLGPLLVVLIGFGIIVMNSRRKSVKATQEADWDKDKEQRLAALLKDDENGDKQ